MPLIKFKKDDSDNERKRLSLSLMATRRCPLKCTYCYEDGAKRIGDMDFNVARDAINYYMERNDGFENVSIEFFGGEPLLVFPLIKEVIEWFLTRTWKKKVFFGIQTNGILLTEEIKNWLIKHREMFTVGFSIDGCKKAHDLNRSNSYDLLIKNVPFFKKYWEHQAAKATFHDKTIPYIAESVIHLESLEINFNGGLVLENIWGDQEQKKKLLEVYEDQLAILVEFYSKRPNLFPPNPLFGTIPEYLCSPESEVEKLKKETTRFCGAGYEMVTIDVDGTSYPCHRFLPLVTGKPAPDTPINRQTQWLSDKCTDCKLLLYCPTCIGLNYKENGNPAMRTTYHCEAYKLQIMASCKLEAIRLSNLKQADFEKLPEDEQDKTRNRLTNIINIIENGL